MLNRRCFVGLAAFASLYFFTGDGASLEAGATAGCAAGVAGAGAVMAAGACIAGGDPAAKRLTP